MSSGRFASAAEQFTMYEAGKYPIKQQEECFGNSIVPYMHRISLGIVGFEQKGGEAVKQ
jgi:hypothetical protein